MENRKILISGAGIAGPTLAYWLKLYGFEPTLVERAPALRQGGYMIDFWGLGMDVAREMGLLPQLKENGYQINKLVFVDGRGKRNGGFPVRALSSSLGDRFVSILRSDLARLIYESLGGSVRTLFGDSIAGLEQNGTGVTVRFNHARTERFDLVIGAAGLHAPVRGLVFGPEAKFEKYLGYYAGSFRVPSGAAGFQEAAQFVNLASVGLVLFDAAQYPIKVAAGYLAIAVFADTGHVD